MANFDLIVFDFKGTLQQKQKKTSHDANKKIEKVKQRAENFYKKLSSDTSLQSLPTFPVFLEELFKIKKVLDENKEVYSWTYLLQKVDAQLSLPSYPTEYYNYFCSPIAPLYPGALEVLEQIANKGIPMVLIRNSSTSGNKMEEILTELKIRSYFTTIVMSGEVHYRKPDPRIFLHCAEVSGFANAAPHRILMVGNETEADISGAKAVGWKTVLYRTTEDSSNGLADHEIDSLHALLPI